MAVEEPPPIKKWFKELPWTAKLRVPCERAQKTVSETGVKSDPAFCLGPTIKKTNSALRVIRNVTLVNTTCHTLCKMQSILFLNEEK